MFRGAHECFHGYLPQSLLLGDFAQRDGVIHSIQVCVPQVTLLPVAIERWEPHNLGAANSCLVHARERERDGELYTYDIEVRNDDGSVREVWTGLVLQVLPGSRREGPWIDGLLGPYLERSLEDVLGGSMLTVAAERNGGRDRRARSDRVLRRVLAGNGSLQRRTDGKPVVANADNRHVSASHAGELVVAAAAAHPVGCDLEPVVARTAEQWRDLLGETGHELAHRIAEESGETFDTAATRVWTARESLVKSGASVDTPLQLTETLPGGWIVLAAGSRIAASVITRVRGEENPLAFTIMVEDSSAGL